MDGVAEQAAVSDDYWSERCSFWLQGYPEERKGRRSRQRHVPLILCGHGIRLQIDHGALLIHDGFTHYPQQRSTYRFFLGAPNLPSRIILLDGSGSISFDVLD